MAKVLVFYEDGTVRDAPGPIVIIDAIPPYSVLYNGYSNKWYECVQYTMPIRKEWEYREASEINKQYRMLALVLT